MDHVVQLCGLLAAALMITCGFHGAGNDSLVAAGLILVGLTAIVAELQRIRRALERKPQDSSPALQLSAVAKPVEDLPPPAAGTAPPPAARLERAEEAPARDPAAAKAAVVDRHHRPPKLPVPADLPAKPIEMAVKAPPPAAKKSGPAWADDFDAAIAEELRVKH